MRTRSRLIGLAAAVTLVLASSLVPAGAASAATPSCSAFTSKVYDLIRPSTGAQQLTIRGDIANSSFMGGSTTVRSTVLSAASASGTGLKSVHLMYRKSNGDNYFTSDSAEIKRLVKAGNYADKGVAFYAGTSPASCLVGVWSYRKGGIHRYTTSATERSQLKAAGWTAEKIRFYLSKKASVGFTIAVIPDTQQEVVHEGDPRMAGRNEWLLKTKSMLGTVFAVHTGDVVNWDTPDHIQYVRAQSAMDTLSGKLPYLLAAGNHDTAAVGVGGSAADPPRTHILARDTTSYNTYLAPGMTVSGQYAEGHAESSYTLFTAGGRKWMALTLELWPRPEIVEWAKQVVADHPHHNVIISTHAYLTSSGAISTSNGGYGATSPKYLFDNLVKRYPNIKIVVSGHVGKSAFRKDVGVNGNTIMSYLLCVHSVTTNPVRMLEINVTAGTVSSYVYAPATKTAYSDYRAKPQKITWVR